MEHSPIKYPGDDDVEDGEISEGSDGGYTPLARPNVTAATASASAAMTANHSPAIIKMEGASDKDDDDDDDDDSPGDASTDSDSDNAIIGQPRDRTAKKRALKIRLKALANNNKLPASSTLSAAATSTEATATGATAPIGTARRKNNIWAAGLQEESLMENLKGCGVDREASSAYDRSVESYDYSLRFRLNGENALKRRKSSNSDSSNERPQTKYNRMYQNATNNRCRTSNGGGDDAKHHHHNHQHNNKRKNVKQRLGRRSNADESSSSNEAGQLDGPRIIADLDAIGAHSTVATVAKDLAGKLHEEKDELMLRIVEILGNELPRRVFAETQRIESEGGMLIMNGKRRRTPGGVFLFLLKNSDDLSAEHRKAIFTEESRKQNREQKLALAQKRDRKVEQLKQTLRIENELTALATRGNGESPQQVAAVAAAAVAAAGASSPSPRRGLGRDESLNNLSNPPPSPVTDGNRENSSDYDTHAIKHVLNMAASPEKMTGAPDVLTVTGAAASAVAAAAVVAAGISDVTTAVAYDDEFLDMHCDDMDMF